MRGQALKLLNFLQQEWQTKQGRLTDLLCSPERESAHGWFMHVPSCFNDALDLRQTPRVNDAGETRMVWTQGPSFDFKTGDVLYDSPANGKWSEDIKNIELCLRVVGALPAAVKDGGRRDHGMVRFEILFPNDQKDALEIQGIYSLTQNAFVAMLIAGEACGDDAVEKIFSKLNFTARQ